MATTTEPTTVVLVHGAFADAGSWVPVIERLLAAGIPVRAPGLPMRGLRSDSDYIASVISQIPGPVLAVGHSYGGAVISNAATQASNVTGLVLVSGFAPEEGEALSEAEGTSRDSALGPALVQAQFPTGVGDETAIELYVDVAKFPAVFAADLPEAQANAFAASQRPIAASAFDEKSGRPRGSACRPGRSSPPATRRPAPTSCSPWPAGRTPSCSSSRARTSSWSPSPNR